MADFFAAAPFLALAAEETRDPRERDADVRDRAALLDPPRTTIVWPGKSRSRRSPLTRISALVVVP